MKEKEDVLFKKLLELAPDVPSEEAYTRAMEELSKILEIEFQEDLSKMINIADNEIYPVEELQEKILNILIPHFVEVKQKIDNDAKALWEKALRGEIKIKDIEKFEIMDKSLFLGSNILGIILETRDFEVMNKLLPYFVLLPARIMKVIFNNKDLSELQEDFKLIARKIKEVHPQPTTVDDYFLEELLEK
ncbi:hypothetical protein [Pyrococcus horikoshii]|uniref:Uncharacterized protein n=1 Tax=Pyrococcus horikoshii TaxID=53953 RepID=A0A832SWY1_PYRHR|nr:hypothetical protein [Pyrococcus horikoshii]HII60197.1 hypothetical protein [Pyrococcus horikoshii]